MKTYSVQMFARDLGNLIQDLSHNQYSARTEKVVNNSGKNQQTLFVEVTDVPVEYETQMAIDCESLYKRFTKGETLKEIAEEIMDIVQEFFEKTNNFSDLFSWEVQKDRILFRAEDREFVSPTSPFTYVMWHSLPLAIYMSSMPGDTDVNLTEEIRDVWGISKEEIFQVALANLSRIAEEELMFYPLLDTIKGTALYDAVDKSSFPPIYCVRLKEHTHGFSALVCPEVRKRIANEIGSYYILPTSKHEAYLYAAKCTDSEEIKRLKEVVRQINADKKAEKKQNFLSNNIWFYDADKDLILDL